MTNQEAIEVIKLAQAQVEWEYPMDYATAFDMAISALQEQELQPTCNELASDTISRQAAIDAMHKEFDECLVWDESGEVTADEVERVLGALPSAQPEIVRCKDCKYVGTDATCCLVCNREGMGLKPYHVRKDDYCSYAERRTDERSD